MAAATANILTMFISATTTNLQGLLAGMIGAAVSTYGWLFFTEEAEAMEENHTTHDDVATRLRWELKNEDRYTPGHRIPSIRQVAARFGVTRRTAGRALQELVTEGLIYTIPGRGCYVAGAPPRDKPIDGVESYIINNIRSNAYLPSHEELARLCQTHPVTVRRAVAHLTRQGILAKNQGKHQRR